MVNPYHLRRVRRALVWARRQVLVRGFGMDIHPTAELSFSAHLDKTYPKGVHIGRHSYVALKTVVLAHDRTRGLYLHTRIGENCFIGACSVIMPGVTIGDGSIVAAGAVVTTDVPPGCIAAGVPAKVVREGITVGEYGRFPGATETTLKLKAAGLL